MKSLKFTSNSFSSILIFLFVSCFFLLSVGTSWASSPSSSSSTASPSVSDVDTTSSSCGDEFTTLIKFCPAGSSASSSSSSSSSAIKVGETLLFNGMPQAMKVKEIKMGFFATNTSNGGNSTTPPRETYQDMRYLITIHASLMFFAFGVLLPIGGFLATNKHLTYHKWFQISGLICAGISYVFAFYFAQINGGHFKFSHGYLGVILLLMALIGQPLFVYLGHYKRRGGIWTSLHRKNGHFLIFFGMANILIGLLLGNAILDIPLYFNIIYGVWLFVLIGSYLLYQPPTLFRRASTIEDHRRQFPSKSGSGSSNSSSSSSPASSSLGTPSGVLQKRGQGYGSVEAEPLLSFQSVSMSTGSRLSELAQYRWQSILEASMDALVGADAEGNVTWWSRRAAQMFGYEETEILGNSLQLLMPERYRALHQEGMERHQFGGGAGEDVETFGRIYEVSGLRKNKKEFPIELSVSKFMVDGKPYFTAVIRDLSSFSYPGPGALLNRGAVHQKNVTALASGEEGTHFLREQRSNSTRAVGVSTIAISSAFQHVYGLRDNTRIYEDELTTIIGRSLGKYHMNFSAEKKQTIVSSLLNAAQVEGRSYILFEEFVRVLSQHGLEIGETGTLTSSKLSLPPHQDGRKKETLKQKKIRKFFRSLSQLRYHIFWVVVWLGINAGLFFYAARNALLDGWNAFTIYTALGNGGGLVLCFDVAFLVVPMCRNLLTYLRTTWVHRFVPFDSSIEFHKILGWCVFGASIIHAVGHYGTIVVKYANGVPVAKIAFTSSIGITGNILLLCTIVMFFGVTNWVRNKYHQYFWISHHFYILYFITLFLHGVSPPWNPNFWKWAVLPFTVFFVDRFIRLARTKLAVQVLTCRSLPSKTVCLELSRPLSFRYRAGQYLFLNIPAISTFEYHPFTITSAPEEGQLRLHIRAVGDWTEKVRNLVLDTDALASSSVINNDENDEGRIEPDNPLYLARIDGPYGAPTEELFRYRYAVFIGAGIGATPASSILRFKCEKLYFYWINRDTDGFEWFAAMLADIKRTDVNDMVEVRCFMTSFKHPKEDLEAMMVHVGLESAFEQTGVDPITGLQSYTEFGRPNWNSILSELRSKHPETDIGVFMCGPTQLADELEVACEAHSGPGQPSFLFHAESFGGGGVPGGQKTFLETFTGLVKTLVAKD